LFIDINLKNKNTNEIINKKENENLLNNVIIKNKITSTMKFYILRKKMYKNQITILKNLENELEYDDIII